MVLRAGADAQTKLQEPQRHSPRIVDPALRAKLNRSALNLPIHTWPDRHTLLVWNKFQKKETFFFFPQGL